MLKKTEGASAVRVKLNKKDRRSGLCAKKTQSSPPFRMVNTSVLVILNSAQLNSNLQTSMWTKLPLCYSGRRKEETINQQSLDSRIPLQYKHPYITDPRGKKLFHISTGDQMAVIISMSHSPETELETISQNLSTKYTGQHNTVLQHDK